MAEETKKTIEIDEDKLKSIMDKISLLEKAADQNKLFQLSNQNKKVEQIVSVRQIGGKLLTGWKLIKNRCEKMPDGKWVEEQVIELTYADNTKEEINYVDFARLTEATKVQCVVMSRTQNLDEDMKKEFGDYSYKLKRMDTGEVIERGSNFVN